MEQENVVQKGFISGGTLKIIAIVSMLTDHTAAVLLEYGTAPYTVMRMIGRLAFPIFCFLLVEGFLHTRNVKKYALRLGLFAAISEVPFDLAFTNQPFETGHQNVFFTLLIGLLVLIAWTHFNENQPLRILSVVAGCLGAGLLRTDYVFMGVLMIVFFYLYRKQPLIRAGSVEFLNLLMDQWIAGAALLPITFYNGKRGISLKYLFYLFYPVHLIILYLIQLYA